MTKIQMLQSGGDLNRNGYKKPNESGEMKSTVAAQEGPQRYPTYGPKSIDLKLIQSSTADKQNVNRTSTPIKSSELPSIPREAQFSVSKETQYAGGF